MVHAQSDRPETFAFWYESYHTLQEPDATLAHIGNPAFVVSDKGSWDHDEDLTQRGIRRLPYITLADTYQWVKTVTEREPVNEIEQEMGPVAFFRRDLPAFSRTPAGMIPAEDSRPSYPTYNPNEIYYAACPNSEILQKKVLAYVRDQIRRGAGGVFVDNGYSDPDVATKSCESPYHRHVFGPSVNASQAFLGLLSNIRDEVKKSNPQNLVLVNGFVPPGTAFQGHTLNELIDGQLWESFLRSSYSTLPQHRADWTYTHELGMQLEMRWLKKDRPHAYVLSYPWDRSEAFFCYATAKLCHLPWSAGLGVDDRQHRTSGGHFGTYRNW